MTAIKGITDHKTATGTKAVYTINGMLTGKNLDELPSGIYIVRENGYTHKVMKK